MPLPSIFRKSHFSLCVIPAGVLVEKIDVSDCRPRKIPAPQWRESIRKACEVGPLGRPMCAGEMKIISFVIEADVTCKILKHLGLWEARVLF